MFNHIVITGGEICKLYKKKKKKWHVKIMAFSKKRKLSVLELQQREHSSCPLLGFPSLHSHLLFRCLPWTCQQHLRNITLTSTVSHQSPYCSLWPYLSLSVGCF